MRENRGFPLLKTSLALVCALHLAAALQAKDDYPSPVTVCVHGVERGGFVTEEVADTVKNLRSSLDDKKVLRLIDDPRSADVVVTVLGRANEETGRRIYRSHSTRRSYRSTTTKETVRVVRAVLSAGSYKLAMFGVDELWWGHAAGDLGKKIEKWVKGNYDQLLARREKRDAALSNAGVEPEGGEEDDAPAAGGSSASTDIKVGMTEHQVATALGAPIKKVGFGRKSQWTYKNMTIVFEGGKVTDVKF